jgi:hypothetical protein
MAQALTVTLVGSAWAFSAALAVGACVQVDAQEGCPAGTADCSGSCVETAHNPAHCGGCGVACKPGEVCANGVCAGECPAATKRCAESCVETSFNPSHCGDCGVACKPGEVCANGACSADCPAPTTRCGGLCIDTRFDPANCGDCGKSCAAGEICAAAACTLQCGGTTTLCGGACVDAKTDPANCGQCRNKCKSEEKCQGGACVFICVGGTTDCDGACVDTDVDAAHCGACDKSCTAGQACVGGKCEALCLNGKTKCGGVCVDTSSDNAHCGACGKSCTAPESCSAGSCVIVQEHVYSEAFTKGVDDPAKCVAWNAFRSSLTGPYTKVSITGSFDPVGAVCTGVNADVICQALKLGSATNVFCGDRTWVTMNCENGLSLYAAASYVGCACQAPGHVASPCRLAASTPGFWGAAGTTYCNADAPSQTITVKCVF